MACNATELFDIDDNLHLIVTDSNGRVVWAHFYRAPYWWRDAKTAEVIKKHLRMPDLWPYWKETNQAASYSDEELRGLFSVLQSGNYDD